MLERFSVTNFKNFKDKITLNLKAANYNFNNEIVSNEKILNFAMIYGYNACGKSNFMLALFDIVYSLTDLNHTERGNQKNINYQNIYKKNELVTFEYKFNFNNNIVQYNYKKRNIDEIVFEELIINDITYIYFDRINNETFEQNFPEITSLNLKLENNNLSALKYLFKNTQLDKNQIVSKTFYSFMDYINNMLLFWSLQDRHYIGYTTGSEVILDTIIKNDWIDEYNLFLKDLNIERKVVAQKLPDGSKLAYYDFGKDYLLPLASNMSNGEASLLLFFYWWEVCKKDKHPSLLCIDEFDAFYHINFSKQLVEKLKQMTNIQVIITSHNPNLISNEILRPDAYNIIQDNKINSINNMTKKELRQAHNLERMFKAGSFKNIEG